MNIVQQVAQILEDGEWHLWSEIEHRTGVTRVEVNATGWYQYHVIGCPKKGIKLSKYATPQEFEQALYSLRSRVSKIKDRIENLIDGRRGF